MKNSLGKTERGYPKMEGIILNKRFRNKHPLWIVGYLKQNILLAWPGIPGGESYFINGWVGKNGEGGGGVRTCLQTMITPYVF